MVMATNKIFELLRDLKLDRTWVAQQLNQVRDDINGFNQRIKDQTALQLSLNVGNLKTKLDEVKAQIKLAKEQGNRDWVIQLTADASRIQQSLTQAGRELRNYTRTWSSDISVLWKNFQGINTEILKQWGIIQSTVQKMKVTFSWLKEIIVTAFSVTAIIGFVKSLFTLSSELQQAKIAFTNMFKSEEIAIKLLKQIQAFAKQTPFDQMGLVDGAKRLSAYWFTAKQILPIMKSLWDAVAGVGWNQDTLNGVIVALGQMKTKWKLVQQEINQIAERGIPIFEILKNKLHLTQEQLSNIWEQGISSAQAIPLILEGINEKFWWLMEQQSKTLQWKLSNMIDSFKIKMAELGLVLAPIFWGIISSLQAIITPVFNILILGIKGLWVIFKTVFDGAKQVYQFFANNFVIITKTILATFLSALVIMKQQTIITFLQWIVNTIIKGMAVAWTAVINFSKASRYFITNLRTIVIEATRATVAYVKKWVALAVTTARTYAQIIANNLASLSFRGLGISILGALKNLLLLGARFFLIWTIVATIVIVIYKNWNVLKEKLKPVFEFMAKIGQAVPGAIAKAWNFCVDVIFWAIKGILKSWKAVADFLKNTFNVDIGSAKIDKYISDIENMRQKLQTNEGEIKSIFADIKEEAVWAFEFVKDNVLGVWDATNILGGDVLSLSGKFDDMGDASESAGKKWSKATQEAKDQLAGLKKETEQVEKANDRLEKAIVNVTDAQQEYNDAVIDTTNQIKNNLRETQREYDKTIKKIKETRDEELKNIELERQKDKSKNTEDFVKSQAEDLAKSQQEQIKLQNKLNWESDGDRRLEIQQEINAEIQKQIQLQQNLDDLRKQAQGDQKAVLDQIIQEQQARAKMTEEQRSYYDFKKQQLDVDKKAQEDTWKANQKAFDDQKKAEEELANARNSMAMQQKIIQALEKVKTVTKEQVDGFLTSKWFSQLDEDSQKLLEKLMDLKLKISDAMKEKNSAQADVNTLSSKLQTDSSNTQIKNIKQVKKEYDEVIAKVNEALKKSQELSVVSQSVWPKKSVASSIEPIKIQPPTSAPVIDNTAQVEQQKTNIQWLTDFKKTKADEDVANKQLAMVSELQAHATAIVQMQTIQLNSINQMQNARSSYYANLIARTNWAVNSMIGSYSRLISYLYQIIALQARASSGRWYASGWFTWWTDRNKVAGVVHEWEYVVPKWMVDKYTPLVMNLEQIRGRGFANGGYTSTTNRSVNINGNIHVGSGFDLNQQMDYWKWKI